MLFGSKEDFAIECYLHDVPVMRKHLVIGRMCVWCGGQSIGDIDDINVLNVSEGFFQDLIATLAERHDDAVDHLPDDAAFNFLNALLYGDDERSLAQIKNDAHRFSKFDFLTNWGESFDRDKAFLLHIGGGLRVLFQRDSEPVVGQHITEQAVYHAVQGFLRWMNDQKGSAEVTEAEWLESTDVDGMGDWLRRNNPDQFKTASRKLRLFVCACCRRIGSLFPDDRSRTAVEIAEQFADGVASENELAAARNAAKDAANHIKGREASFSAHGYAAWAAVYAAYDVPSVSAAYNTRVAVRFASGDDARPANLEAAVQADILRDIFGNPFRAIFVARSCLTTAVISLAQAIYNDRRFEQLPQLADALEQTGCTSTDVLEHCRGPGPHVRGCWVIDLVLGKR